MPARCFHHDPVAVTNADGHLEVFIVGDDGQLYHSWQMPSGAWSSWGPLGGNWPGQPTVARNRDGRLEVFSRGLNCQIYHAWQNPNGVWSTWFAIPGGCFHRDPVATSNADGHLEVFVVGDNGNLYHSWQMPSGAWSGWGSLGPIGMRLTTQPAIGHNKDGHLEVFLGGQDGQIYHTWQQPNGTWSSWPVPPIGTWCKTVASSKSFIVLTVHIDVGMCGNGYSTWTYNGIHCYIDNTAPTVRYVHVKNCYVRNDGQWWAYPRIEWGAVLGVETTWESTAEEAVGATGQWGPIYLVGPPLIL
jgi:hypothetical protein